MLLCINYRCPVRGRVHCPSGAPERQNRASQRSRRIQYPSVIRDLSTEDHERGEAQASPSPPGSRLSAGLLRPLILALFLEALPLALVESR